MDLDRFLVPPGRRLRLSRYATDRTHGVKDKGAGERRLARNVEDLAEAQERLYAQDQYAVLVILQALDAAGKDSTVKHVMSGVNPQGVRVTSFKEPSKRELNHDYLWRSVRELPERGTIGIHNRSYYEEVLVVRVHPELVEAQHLPPSARRGDLWGRRFRQINEFERYLVENGTIVLKFFLHVSKEKQRQRFLDRLAVPDKHWKFSLRDVQEREHWRAYQRAYEDMLAETSTDLAPWYVIPADRRWYTHLTVGEILVHHLRALKLDLPPVDAARRRELREGKKLLDA